jgi:hypothetical protein
MRQSDGKLLRLTNLKTMKTILSGLTAMFVVAVLPSCTTNVVPPVTAPVTTEQATTTTTSRVDPYTGTTTYKKTTTTAY